MQQERIANLLLIAALLLMAPAAVAQDAPRQDAVGISERWRATLSVSVKAQQQGAQAQVASSLFTTRGGNPPAPLAADVDKDASLFSVALPISAEIMGPAWKGLPGTPRPFFEAGYQVMPAGNRKFLEQGRPGPVTLPASPTSQGLGVALDVDLRHQWLVSAGLAFPTEIWERRVEVRPSFDYLGQSLRLDARVVGVDVANSVFELRSNASQAFHFIGPRLGFEAEAGRAGPLRFVFFLDVAGYFRVGESAASARSSLGAETAGWSYEPERFTFQGGLGARIVWDPIAPAIRP